MHRLPILFFLTLFALQIHGQQTKPSSCNCPAMTKTGKGIIYTGIGFHRVFFTKSNIHFKNNTSANYDFTLHKVKAEDDNDFRVGKGFGAPQFSILLGYYFKSSKKGLGIELSYDHVKYIAVQDQKLRVTGQINGAKLDKDTVMSKSFVEYEHTDGANYYMINLLKRKPLLHSKNEKHWLSVVLKPGAGLVIPRSDTRIMGFRHNERYNIAGFVIGMDGGLRYDFLNYFFAQASAITAYAHYGNVLLYGGGRAKQHWFSLQTMLIVGFQFPL